MAVAIQALRAPNSNSEMAFAARAVASTCLIPHDAVVGEHLGDGGPVRKHSEFLGRMRLEHATVIHDRRADRDDPRFRTDRRAGGQQARRDREDGEPQHPAYGVGHHLPSP